MTNTKHIRDTGGDGRVIVLIPGFTSSLKYWHGTQKFLSDKGFRVISLDLLGFGNAPKPKDIKYNYEDHVGYIHKILGDLNLGDDICLIGHSMGALLAARYTNTYPNEVNRLMLLHPPMYISRQQAYNTLRSTSKLYRLILDSRQRGLLWIFLRLFTMGFITKHTNTSRDRTLFEIIEAAEIFTDLDKIAVPTLLLVGNKDRKQYSQNLIGKKFNKNIHLKIEDVTHQSVIFKKGLIREIIINFLKD